MSLELHAALGFLQAIHHSARVAKVNSKCCRLLSRAVGKIRPLLEELDMAAADGEVQPKLASLSTALENVHMVIVRFSAMGELQAVLESETMVGKFTQACEELASTLQSLLADNKCLENMEDDINSISEQLVNLNISNSLTNRQIARDVRTAAVQILEGKCSASEGHMKIRNLLYIICRYARDDMLHEMKGLERERSRAKAEGDELELGIITEVIRALERRTPAAAAAAAAAISSPPQPPVEYLCPISHMIMTDPVILVETGQTYDRPSIEEWFRRGNNVCPITKRVVQQFQLAQNFALKSLATTWIEVNGREAQEIESIDTCGGPAGFRGQATAGLDTAYQKNHLKQLGGLMGTFDLGIIPVMQAQPFVQSALPEMTLGKLGYEGMGLSKKSIACEKETVKTDIEECKKHVKTGHERAKSFTLAPANPALEALKKALGNRPNSFERPRSVASNNDTSDRESTAPELGGDNVVEGKISHKTPPIAPRRCSMDSSYTYARVCQSPQPDDARAKATRASGEFSRMAPLSKQGGVQFLQDAISTCSRSLDKRRPPTLNSENQRRKSCEPMSVSKSVISGQRNGSEQSASPRCTSTGGPRPMDFGCPSQLFPGLQQNESFSLLSASSYSCSMSSQSDSCDEQENYIEYAGRQNNDKDTATMWHNTPDFDTLSFASLSTIAPGGFKVAPSLGTSFGKKSSYSRKQALPRSGAVNLLFDDCRSECPEMDSTEVSIPVLIEMIKSDDVDVATASANELAMRVFKDTGLEVEVGESGLIEKLVKMLDIEDSEARLAAARTLGTLSEKCSQAREQIVESGASRSLADLTKAGSVRCMDVADWALNRLSLDSGRENQSSASVEVSTPMLVQMLLSGDIDVQASAVLDLKDRLLKSFNGFEGLTQPDAIWKLVELLEYERPDIQLAAATVLSLLVFRSQDVHNQVATRAGTVIRLIRLVKDANDSCAAAAAQVLRTLAHGNSDVCEEIFCRGIIPSLEDLLTCPTGEDGAREVAAWLLGILGLHSEESQEVIQGGVAISNLQHLLEVGQPNEVIAASWALQSILSAPGEANECEVSIPIVLESLKSDCENIRVASVAELCHLANEGFWFQMEILKSGGLQSLLEFLDSGPCADGTHGALVAIEKLVKDVPSCPLELCRDGGVPVLVSFLKTDDSIERQLAMDILLILADRCPLHQPEVVTEGAVPLLVNLLINEEPSVCAAAYEVLHKLADSDMSVVSVSMASVSAPALLEILELTGGNIDGKEAAARLIETISNTVDGQQELLKHNAMQLMMKVMDTGESYILKKCAGNAVAALAKKDSKAHGNLAGAGVFSNLVGLLQTSRIPRASGTKGPAADSFDQATPSASSQLQKLSAKAFGNPLSSRLYSHNPLPAVPESIAEESEAGDAHSAYGYGCNACSVIGSETTSCTCPESGATPLEVESCASELGEDVKVLVNILKNEMGSGKEDAATRLRSLAQFDKASRLELVKSGAVPLLVEMLQTKSFK